MLYYFLNNFITQCLHYVVNVAVTNLITKSIRENMVLLGLEPSRKFLLSHLIPSESVMYTLE